MGWRLYVGETVRPNTLLNFRMHATGAELPRLACCLASERGVRVHAPVHDALLVEGPADQIADVVARTIEAVDEAARAILGDAVHVRADAKIAGPGERYVDPCGVDMWIRGFDSPAGPESIWPRERRRANDAPRQITGAAAFGPIVDASDSARLEDSS